MGRVGRVGLCEACWAEERKEHRHEGRRLRQACLVPSSAFNNILSNLGYILLGLLFLLIILQREINHNRALLRNDLYALVSQPLPIMASIWHTDLRSPTLLHLAQHCPPCPGLPCPGLPWLILSSLHSLAQPTLLPTSPPRAVLLLLYSPRVSSQAFSSPSPELLFLHFLPTGVWDPQTLWSILCHGHSVDDGGAT